MLMIMRKMRMMIDMELSYNDKKQGDKGEGREMKVKDGVNAVIMVMITTD